MILLKRLSGSGITKTITIYAKTKGSITHLVEFGFNHKSGKYVAARPLFLRPAFDALMTTKNARRYKEYY